MANKEVKFEPYNLEDYPEISNIDFPEEIYIAYAVCGNECGNKEFIVDGTNSSLSILRKTYV